MIRPRGYELGPGARRSRPGGTPVGPERPSSIQPEDTRGKSKSEPWRRVCEGGGTAEGCQWRRWLGGSGDRSAGGPANACEGGGCTRVGAAAKFFNDPMERAVETRLLPNVMGRSTASDTLTRARQCPRASLDLDRIRRAGSRGHRDTPVSSTTRPWPPSTSRVQPMRAHRSRDVRKPTGARRIPRVSRGSKSPKITPSIPQTGEPTVFAPVTNHRTKIVPRLGGGALRVGRRFASAPGQASAFANAYSQNAGVTPPPKSLVLTNRPARSRSTTQCDSK